MGTVSDKASRNGLPSRKREADSDSAHEEKMCAQVGAWNAQALLQAAAVLQPGYECQGEESGCTTVLTDATRGDSAVGLSTAETDEDLEGK